VTTLRRFIGYTRPFLRKTSYGLRGFAGPSHNYRTRYLTIAVRASCCDDLVPDHTRDSFIGRRETYWSKDIGTVLSTLDDACGKAMNLQLEGQLHLAEQMYRSILEAQPAHAVASHCLGMLSVQLRRPADGLPYLLAALNAHPENPDYWLGYLEALLQAGQIGSAKAALALGRQHGLSGEAVEQFARRLPAVAAQSPGPTRAERRREALILRREDQALLDMIAQRRFVEGLAQARTMTERFPGHGLGWKILGALMWAEGRTDEALTAMQTSVRLLPQDPEAFSNFGVSLANLKRYDEAETHLRRALTIDPAFAGAHYRLGMAYELQGRYGEAESALRNAVSLRSKPTSVDDEQGFSNLLYLLSHNADVGADSLFAEHRRFAECVESPLRGSWMQHTNTSDPERRLQIGLVSGDLREHSVATFLEPALARLTGRSNLELHAYYNHSAADGVTARLREHFHHWHPISSLTDVELTKRISDDRIDILVDLSGHTALNRLPAFARKPAPVQASWLGYPGTTGLQAMDYYLADRDWLTPGEFERLFSEKLVFLPDRWAFQTHADAPAVGALPALKTRHLTFGSFHRIGKINSATVRMWSELLVALPQSTLLAVGIPLDGQHDRLKQQFAAQGIAPERLTFHDRCTMDVYLALHRQVDIGLDTYPYSGATTTMHSLSMGVPTLTVAGATSTARACAGILKKVGLDGFIATNPGNFVEKGVYWARHLTALAEERAGLRSRLQQSPGGQPELIAAHLEVALRHMWRRWCAGLPAVSFDTSAV
jgi:predicted O-linked N-acetylglucosamine transferase (SPINDLY family)